MARERLRLVLQEGERRPRLTPALIASLLSQVQAGADALLCTIQGGAEAFCTGLDLEAMAGQAGAQLSATAATPALEDFAALLAAIERAPQPVVALVGGPALGGGVGLAAAADLVLATEEATFGLPEAVMGLIPAVVFPVVARRIGVARARLLALGGMTLSAAEAHRIGLVDKIVEDLEVAAQRYARRFARMDRRALAAVKSLVATHFSSPPGYDTDAAARFQDLLASSETRARLSRFAAGEAPWQEEGEA